jgi:hypothetical protein
VAPFVMYGSLSESLCGPWLLGLGPVLLGICAVIVIRERFLHSGTNATDFFYWLPLLASLIVLPIAYVLGRRKDN